MLNVIKRKIDLKRMVGSATEFGAIVGRDGINSQFVVLIEKQDIIVKQGNCAFRFLACVQEAKGIRTVGSHYCM